MALDFTLPRFLRLNQLIFIRAVDPDSMNPDPEFKVNPDPNLIRIQGFDDQNMDKKKKSADIFIDQILQFTYP